MNDFDVYTKNYGAVIEGNIISNKYYKLSSTMIKNFTSQQHSLSHIKTVQFIRYTPSGQCFPNHRNIIKFNSETWIIHIQVRISKRVSNTLSQSFGINYIDYCEMNFIDNYGYCYNIEFEMYNDNAVKEQIPPLYGSGNNCYLEVFMTDYKNSLCKMYEDINPLPNFMIDIIKNHSYFYKSNNENKYCFTTKSSFYKDIFGINSHLIKKNQILANENEVLLSKRKWLWGKIKQLESDIEMLQMKLKKVS